MPRLALAAAVLALGCNAPAPGEARRADTAPPADAAKKAAKAPPEPAPAARGTLSGRVVFQGQAPAPIDIEISGRDARRCGEAIDFYEREVLVGADGGLGEVLVAIQGAGAPAGRSPAEIDVEIAGCAFRPRVIDATAGDSLVFENHDPIVVLPLIPDRTTPMQAALLRGQRFPRPLPRAGGFRMTDSTTNHPWMYAHVLVLPHPYHVVTAEDGRFAFRDVPAGSYRLNFWHPKLGQKVEAVTVVAGETRTADVTYAADVPAAPAP